MKKYNVQKIINTAKNKIDQRLNLHVNLLNIDSVIKYYISEVMQPTVQYSNKLVKVPVIYAAGQRWAQLRKRNYMTTEDGFTTTPYIAYNRTSMQKFQKIFYGRLDVNFPTAYIIKQDQFSIKNPFSKFDMNNNIAPKRDFYLLTLPRYVNIDYRFMVYTDYIQHMNTIIQLFAMHDLSFWHDKKFRFRVDIGSISNSVQVETQHGRVVKCEFDITVNGYLLPDIKTAIPQIQKAHNLTHVKFSFGKERIIK